MRAADTGRHWMAALLAGALLLALPAFATADETDSDDVALQFRAGPKGESSLGSFTLDPVSLGDRLEHLAEYLRVQSFVTLGLDPYVPVREQFIRTDTYYIPVAGYEKLKPDTVASYMYFMFGKTFAAMTAADAKAKELAAAGVSTCDKNLVLRAIADLKIVLGVYKERLAHARDVRGMNENQLAYYASELSYLMDPGTDNRYVVGYIPIPWKQNIGTKLDDYLGIEVSRFLIMRGGFSLENVLDAVEWRRQAIETLDAKVAALVPYLESNISVVSGNIARLEAIAAGM
jgi:hypothetical protein